MRAIIYYEGKYDQHIGKFLNSIIKYRSQDVVGIFSYNPTKSLRNYASEKNIPLIEQIIDIPKNADALIISNLHFKSNKIPERLLNLTKILALKQFRIYNGDHIFLSDYFPDFKNQIIDLRKFNDGFRLFKGKIIEKKSQIRILTVGMDCNIGKMTTSLELYNSMKKLNSNVKFIATGQIGMLITQTGIPLDRTIVDFTSGELENYLLKYNDDFLIIEGQGSLYTPLYSGLAVSQVHGSAPHMMILCIDPCRKSPRYFDSILLPQIKEAISSYESIARLVNDKSKIIGISANTSTMNEIDAKKYIEFLEKRLKIPVTDSVRFGMSKIVEEILKWK